MNKIKYWRKNCKWQMNVLERDNFTCVDCGTTEGVLLVHHIDESRKTGKLNNNLDNLVTVCRPCHARRHNFVVTHEDVVEMRLAGISCAEIGRRLGVSRQRVYQITKSYRERFLAILDERIAQHLGKSKSKDLLDSCIT